MLLRLTLSTLCCVLAQLLVCGRATGRLRGGNEQARVFGSFVNFLALHGEVVSDAQDNEAPVALSLRELLEEERIDGGQPAPKKRFPYACSLRAPGPRIHTCGGTLIAPEWVLTAAHCFGGKDSLGPAPLVFVGAHEINDEEFAEVIWAQQVIIHEKYTGKARNGFDIALVRLEEPAKRKKPIKMASRDLLIEDGQFLATVGWGRFSDRGALPDKLQFADQLQAVANVNCKASYKFLQDSMMCTHSGGLEQRQAICDGDSGGPLLIGDNKGEVTISGGNPKLDLLVGIVSFGPRDCDASKPDGYTRLSSFRDWIDEKMQSPPPPPGTVPSRQATREQCKKNCEGLNRKLISAARSGNFARVDNLLSKGANASATDQTDTPALHIAADGGHLDIVEVLIEAGADINARAQAGNPLGGLTALHSAAGAGFVDVVKFLLQAGAPVDSKSYTGHTPLNSAAFFGRSDVIEVLLEAGADINNRDFQGWTPIFHVAGLFGRGDILQLLLNNGAEVDAQSQDGATALMVAAVRGNDEAMEILLEAGADRTIETDNGVTAEDLYRLDG